ncbi:hypothetical protein HZC53_01750 [Candidatus Uhrbacteria bacterium]|nr:hypothetical protein [Candidatus Uhrbacteria bacterium]
MANQRDIHQEALITPEGPKVESAAESQGRLDEWKKLEIELARRARNMRPKGVLE